MNTPKRILLLTSCLFPTISFALSNYGLNLSLPVVAKEPPDLRGYQLMLQYYPTCLTWRKFNIYFDAGFSRFWVTNTPYYTTVNIYSAAPVVRYHFERYGNISPYLEFSIGLAYLNHTHLEDRKLGIHFAFQDRLGIGAMFGNTQQLSIGIHAVHYSNASMSEHNSGLTIPLVLDIGYRF